MDMSDEPLPEKKLITPLPPLVDQGELNSGAACAAAGALAMALQVIPPVKPHYLVVKTLV